MPNRRQHQKIGTTAGAVLLALWDIIDQKTEMESAPGQKFNYGRLLGRTALGAGGGFALSTAADVLEPAHHSHHRDFFHSITALGLLSYGTYKLNKSNMPKEIKQAGTAAAVGYASHIIADGDTPRSVPFMSKSFF